MHYTCCSLDCKTNALTWRKSRQVLIKFGELVKRFNEGLRRILLVFDRLKGCLNADFLINRYAMWVVSNTRCQQHSSLTTWPLVLTVIFNAATN